VRAVLETKNCPLCRSEMFCNGEAYAMNEIFRLWRADGISFSCNVVSEHCKKPEIKLFDCGHCRLGMFFPIITGSAAFYEELQEAARWYYSEVERWQFTSALNDIRVLQVTTISRTLLEVGCGDGNFL
jgi:hypothetical protein